MATDERTPLLKDNNRPAVVSNYNGATDSPASGSGSGSPSGSRTPVVQNVNGGEGGGYVTEMPPISYLAPILASLWIPVFVASLDSTIVATLLNSISSTFGHSEQSAWLGTSYLLSFAAFSPVYARLCDIIGRKTSILIALTFFTLGTLLCGIAGSMNALLIGRAVAGIGGGGMPTIVSVVMSDLVPLKNRGLLQGITNCVFGVAAGLGGPLGGWMNDTTGWRVAFLVQIPLLAMAYICIIKFVPGAPRKTPAQLAVQSDNAPQYQPGFIGRTKRILRFIVDMDIPGNIALISSIVTILTAVSLMSANDLAISDPKVIALLSIGCVSIVTFVGLEWSCGKRESQGAKPVLPLRLLASRTGAGVAGANFFLSIFAFSILYQFPLIFQTVLLQSASVAGLHLIPNSIALSIGSVTAGWYMRKTGRFYWFNLVNAVLLTVASVCISGFDVDTPKWWTYVAIVPSGFGIAAVLTCTLIAAMNTVERKDIAVMTGMTYLFRSNAQVLGVALSGVLLQTILKEQLRQRITGPNADQIISQIRHQASIVPSLSPELRQAAVESYRVALRSVFMGTTVVGLFVIFFCAIIRDEELPDYEKVGPKGKGRAVEEGRVGEEGQGEVVDRD
ncbi:hypothetical protein A4X09_0g6625 [Tilletia walkeri]|uniref:Major facilitator superfamily (MFS) profile domain-containing protein n=1 Tax=Tilletia walkeri TaxID=117179 RepID=A0A8X7N4T8_9BASI|nr:hypothetical protein A4X09_0g6625 [Tilletia walkeri]